MNSPRSGSNSRTCRASSRSGENSRPSNSRLTLRLRLRLRAQRISWAKCLTDSLRTNAGKAKVT